MVGHIMSRRQEKLKKKASRSKNEGVKTGRKGYKAKIGKLSRGVSGSVKDARYPSVVSSGQFSGRAFSYRKSQGGPSGRPRGKSRVWHTGDPQVRTPKDGHTISRTYNAPRKNIGVVKASRNCIEEVPPSGPGAWLSSAEEGRASR